MAKLFGSVLLAASLMAAPVAAESLIDTTRGYAYAFLDWVVYVGDPGGIVSTGSGEVLTDIDLVNDYDVVALGEIARLTLSNVSEETVGLSITGGASVFAEAFISTPGVGVDTSASLSVTGPGINFDATRAQRGVYTCTNDDPSSPDFDCFGLSLSGDAASLVPAFLLSLVAGETVTYDFRATARAAIGPGVAAVPLPAGGALLAMGLVGLALLRRRRAATD